MGTATLKRPQRGQLLRQLGSVAADLPRFATAPLYRRWHLRWGATPAELAASMPGDDLLPAGGFMATRAITIGAPPQEVWPWLVQVGCLRGGWYSNDLLDNLGRPSTTEVVPELQRLEIGQWVPMAPTPTEASAFKVAGYELDRWLLWTKPDSTWAWRLTPVDGGTRLVTRVHATFDWRRPLTALLWAGLMEHGDFAMMRRMLLGIKHRAEAAHG